MTTLTRTTNIIIVVNKEDPNKKKQPLVFQCIHHLSSKILPFQKTAWSIACKKSGCCKPT